jgi:nitroreductase
MASPQPELELFARQRACRSFRAEPVDDVAVEAVLWAATRAPSAQNLQPWQFVVVREPTTRQALWELAGRLWVGGGREALAADTAAPLQADVDRGLTGGYAQAPVTIVVGAERDRCPPGAAGSSLFPAVQNLLLAATALGLGSALTTIATYAADELRELVGLPGEVDPVAVVPLGHPSASMGPNRREPVTAHAHRDRYGRPW